MSHSRLSSPSVIYVSRQAVSQIFLFPQTMGHPTRGRSCSSSSRQRTATQRWLSKPGVREAQNAKARARAALNRARRKKKKLTDDQTAPIASSIDDCEDLSHESIDDCEDLSRDVSWDANDDSVLTMDNDLPCPCDSQTLDSTERIFQRWRKEWLVSEDKWGEAYEEALAHARTEGTHETDIFLDQCAMHALEGRTILEAIRGIVHTSCPYCRERLKYDSVLLYNLLVSVVSQVKFMEVKLDNEHCK
ncbi:hypothetical protein DEU56DRAFT_915858 [Suillus clintonianus]|uniref:uncharacterized protein n=1 Tax=Suillus clintonianus TaxID=1904413 RepID=UPI001B862BAF|nr:uncharacterized protein DEU56DRAFT_915858 [Suillus clintonianus]KAG2126904.1 hypothetical protein DEU56DRAFT_915858 [Suillus clintonianus]